MPAYNVFSVPTPDGTGSIMKVARALPTHVVGKQRRTPRRPRLEHVSSPLSRSTVTAEAVARGEGFNEDDPPNVPWWRIHQNGSVWVVSRKLRTKLEEVLAPGSAFDRFCMVLPEKQIFEIRGHQPGWPQLNHAIEIAECYAANAERSASALEDLAEDIAEQAMNLDSVFRRDPPDDSPRRRVSGSGKLERLSEELKEARMALSYARSQRDAYARLARQMEADLERLL